MPRRGELDSSMVPLEQRPKTAVEQVIRARCKKRPGSRLGKQGSKTSGCKPVPGHSRTNHI